ncbi:MAG: glycoside hydrolase family 28 protein [bacterium]
MIRLRSTLGWFGIVAFCAVYVAAEQVAPEFSFYSVKAFGAVGDGASKDTEAIQSAIDAAHDAGGGTVYFPAGVYLSGTLRLKSHVTLHLEAGSTLLGSTQADDFPSTPPRFRSYTEKYVHQSLLFGEDLENVTLEGRGVIDGQGAAYKGLPYRKRPYIIRLVGCRTIRVRDITIRNSPMWVQHYLACDDLAIHGIHVESHVNANNDGINIDCCRNVRISDCFIHSGDDAIVLKSTGNRTTENVTVTNCVLSTICNAIKLGTESNGGFRNITVSNCAVRKPGPEENWDRERRGLAAIALMIVDGGTLERVNISDITVRGMGAAVFVRLGNRARPYLPDGPKPDIGQVKDVMIRNVIASDIGPTGCSITGLPGHPVENVSLSDIRITFEGGGEKTDADREIPEVPEEYPEFNMFEGPLPAYGFYSRHVQGLRLSNIDLTWEKPDARSALFCEDVEDLELDRFSGRCLPDGLPMMVLKDVRRALIRGCLVPEDTNVFLRLQGETKQVSVIGNDLSLAETPFEFTDGTPTSGFYSVNNREK